VVREGVCVLVKVPGGGGGGGGRESLNLQDVSNGGAMIRTFADGDDRCQIVLFQDFCHL